MSHAEISTAPVLPFFKSYAVTLFNELRGRTCLTMEQNIWEKICSGILYVGSLLLWMAEELDGSHLSCFLNALRYTCWLQVLNKYVLHDWTSDSQSCFVRARQDWHVWGSPDMRNLMTVEGKQLHWVVCTEDKAPFWHWSWPNLRHQLCDSTLDNLIQSSCSFMPDVFRLYMEYESCWTLSPKWYK